MTMCMRSCRLIRASACAVIAFLAVVHLSAFADAFRMVAPVESGALLFHDQCVQIQFNFTREDGYYRRIGFTMENLSSEPIAIDWNRSSITLPSGEASNVLHEGMDYADAGTHVALTTLPPGSRAVDAVIPTSHLQYSSAEGWTLRPIRLTQRSELGFYLALSSRQGSWGYSFRFRALEIQNPQPIAQFQSEPTGPGALQVVASPSPDPDGVEPQYRWDFGDGSGVVFGRRQSHTYRRAGTHEVTLLVTDSWGRTASFAREIIVEEPPAQASASTLTMRKRALFSVVAIAALVFIATEPIRWFW
jgi:hypothetical protein